MEAQIIDVCCGARSFWYDKHNPLTVFCDKRNDGEINLCNGQTINISPDIVCDFKYLPFEDNSFSLAVFDPPHLINKSENAWLVKKYGTLPADWENELKSGFDECMRVLKPGGVLIFKWNETEVKTSSIIEVFGVQPLFGHRSGKRMGTHWLVFMKVVGE